MSNINQTTLSPPPTFAGMFGILNTVSMEDKCSNKDDALVLNPRTACYQNSLQVQ